MMKKYFIQWIALGMVSFYAFTQLQGCANMVPPSGGPRDSIPAYRIAAKPKDSSLNISPKEIVIAFNEFITTQSLQENLIISPSLKNTPLIDAKLNMLRIRINDTLLKNTTYSLQFGEAIKDVNEGNITKNFTFVFSTGSTLDTGTLSGSVRVAETGEIDSTLIVVLHPTNTDSAIYKDKPLYYTRINGKGKFEFKFLPYSNFDLFVLPNDYNKKYDDSTKMFGYVDKSIQITNATDSVKVAVFEAFKKTEKKKSTSTNSNKNAKKPATGLRYSKNLEGNEQDLLSNLTLSFETPIQLNDSFPILLCDTLNKPLSDFTISIDTLTKKVITLQHHWTEMTKFHLIIPKKSIKDTLDNILIKTDTLKFITKSETAYGAAIVRVNGLQNVINPVLLLTQGNKVKFSFPLNQSILRIAQLPPGDFNLKLLSDTNKNGHWDTGKYGKLNQQPEIVKLLSTVLNIKANWENEVSLTINK